MDLDVVSYLSIKAAVARLFLKSNYKKEELDSSLVDSTYDSRGGGGSTLGISGWGCAAGTLELLSYTRASSAEFCYPILE